MNENSGAIRISLRQADGEFFPLFRYGDPDTRNLSLVPAAPGQDEADIQFFFHPADGTRPRKIGTLRFPDLPVDEGEIELQLDASLGQTGLLSVAVRHRDSGRTERLEAELPDDPAAPSDASSLGRRRSGRGSWILGALFVAAGLALALWLTWIVTGWGREEPLEPPLSLHAAETPGRRA